MVSFLKNKKTIYFSIIALLLLIFILISSFSSKKGTSVFSISQIIAYSSADIINQSNSDSLTNLGIDQFTDISIKIDNNTDNSPLNEANTVKELSIDNIVIKSKSTVGTPLLNYKSPMNFAKYQNLSSAVDNKIDFTILTTNEQNRENNYTSPVFYTDCSNPITLGYINKNIVDKYSISNNKTTISYNAKVLKDANVQVQDISNSISFDIHITSNTNQKYIYTVDIDLGFNDDLITSGYSYIINNLPKEDFTFTREKSK